MEIYNKLNQVRVTCKSTTKQKVLSIVNAIIAGVILGLAAKLVDNPYINPIFDGLPAHSPSLLFSTMAYGNISNNGSCFAAYNSEKQKAMFGHSPNNHYIFFYHDKF